MALPTYVGAGDEAAGLGAVSPPLPVDAVPGHGLLLVAEGTTTAGQTPPTGWTELASGHTGGETRLLVWARRMEAGDTAPTVPDLGDHTLARIHAFAGILETGDWWNVLSTVRVQDTAVATLTVNGATTTVDDCLVVLMAALAGQTAISEWTNADLANLTTRGGAATALGNGGSIGSATGEKATAGAYGNSTATITSQRFVSVSIALKPSSGATVTKTHSTDAVAQGAATKQHSADGLGLGAQTKVQSTDAVGKATLERSHSADAFAAGAGLLAHSADGLGQASLTAQHSTDAEASVASATRSHTTDAIGRAEGTKAHATNAVGIGVSTKQHAADARALGVQTRSHSTTAIAVGEPTGQIRLVHTFISPDGLETRELPITAMPGAQLVGAFRGRGQAPGGFMGATAEISEAECVAHPNVYRWGATWIVRNEDDFSNVVWAGRLTDPAIVGAVALLQGQGEGQLADKVFDRRLWQTRDLSGWSAPDAEPFNYKNSVRGTRHSGDEFTTVSGSSTVLGSTRRLDSVGTVIKHNLSGLNAGEAYEVRFHGKATNSTTTPKVKCSIYNETDNVQIEKGSRKLDWTDEDEIVPLGFKPTAGKTYSVRMEFTEGNPSNTKPELSFTRHAKTPEVTSEKIEARAGGRHLVWIARRGKYFGGEATGLLHWTPLVHQKRIAFTIEKSRATKDYRLDLLGGTGPDGDLTQIDSWELSAGSAKSIDKTITGNYDLLMLRLHRKEASEAQHARRVKVQLINVRIGSLALTDDYKTHEVVEDLAASIGGSTANIRTSTRNVLPLDAEDVSAGEILDEIALLDDYMWAVEHDGTEREWRYQPWDERIWTLDQGPAPTEFLPLERFNQVRVPYRYPGGHKDFITVLANPNPLPSGLFSMRQIDLDDPLPPKFIAEAFAGNVADYLAQVRKGGRVECTQVKDAFGVTVAATRVRAGDTLRLAHYGNLELRVGDVEYSDVSVVITFAEGHPLLDRILARRKLILARGRGNTSATLGGFDIERPEVPGDVVLAFKEVEKRGGRRKFHAVLDWAEVTEDIEGHATAIQRYTAQFRPVDGSGTPIPEAQGGGIRRVVIDRKQLDDPEVDDLPTKAWHRNLEHPNRWHWQARVLAVDVFGAKSHFSAWTPFAKPATFGPPAPTNITLELRQKQLEGDWEAPDPEETETDGEPTLDQRIAFFKGKWMQSHDNGATWTNMPVAPGSSKVWWRTRATEKSRRVRRTRGRDFKMVVVSVDHYGNESS